MKTLVTLIIIFILLSLQGLGQNLNSGLIGCWEFNEASGTVANAANKPTVNGTIDGATVNQAGKVGKAYDFDGADDEVVIPITDHYADFSFSAWIYLDSYGESNVGRVMEKRDNGGTQVLLIYVEGNVNTFKLHFSCAFSTTGGRWMTNINTILTGAWYHIAVTYNNSDVANNAIWYINGSSVTLTEASTPVGTVTTNNNQYHIGNRGEKDRSFDGIIDQPCIWNRILTPAEVTQLYNAGVGYQFAGKNAFMTNF